MREYSDGEIAEFHDSQNNYFDIKNNWNKYFGRYNQDKWSW
jgi:hypothetical protein